MTVTLGGQAVCMVHGLGISFCTLDPSGPLWRLVTLQSLPCFCTGVRKFENHLYQSRFNQEAEQAGGGHQETYCQELASATGDWLSRSGVCRLGWQEGLAHSSMGHSADPGWDFFLKEASAVL